MNTQPKKERAASQQHSKAFDTGLEILAGEIDLALKWDRASILIAVHFSKQREAETQSALENIISRHGQKIVYTNVNAQTPDVIRQVCGRGDIKDTIFFVTGLGNANSLSSGQVFQALNNNRELLVESRVRIVFWLSGVELTELSRHAPDFWAFRHRVVEFESGRGSRKHLIPAGAFFWNENILHGDDRMLKKDRAQDESLLSQLPDGSDSLSIRLDVLLRIIHRDWLLKDLQAFSTRIQSVESLLQTHPFPEYQAWLLSAQAVVLYEEGKFQEACDLLSRANEILPDDPRLAINAALALHGVGRNSDAIQLCKRAIKSQPNNPAFWLVMGYIYMYTRKMTEAVESMRKAYGLDPYETNSLFALAICLNGNNQPEESAAALSSIEKDFASVSLIQQACHLILMKKMDEAVSQLQRAIREQRITLRQLTLDPNLYALLSPQELELFE
ncbi:MAG: tetratricopeptide repeat protein [Anaerolineales bacterium]|uniref:tetratricopeptide repeat protein n=1 Tax=Candidatus Villigracilis vicinus TaxID=3140679 RepID=UPI003136D939|nr:tetratricopeptide repeat protein [Anaerolineales bacterium]